MSELFETIAKIRAIIDEVKDPVEDDWDPIELGLLVSKLEYEDLDLKAQREAFEALCQDLHKSYPRDAGPLEQARHVTRYFGQTLGFSGDRVNYYNIKNSYLSDVFVRRKGIPLSLSLVFMGLCRSVGLKAVGIGFPGHFLVRIIPGQEIVRKRAAAGKEVAEDWKQQHFVDCFEGGSFLTVQDCEKRLNDWTRGVLPFGPDALKISHPQEILSRMLRNLKAIFSEKEDYARMYWVLTALLELCPLERTEALKDRGFLLARMSRFHQATQDLRAFMQLCTDPAKLSHVEKMIRFFSDQSDLMN